MRNRKVKGEEKKQQEEAKEKGAGEHARPRAIEVLTIDARIRGELPVLFTVVNAMPCFKGRLDTEHVRENQDVHDGSHTLVLLYTVAP